MTPVGVFFIYPNEDKLGFVNSANLCGFSDLVVCRADDYQYVP